MTDRKAIESGRIERIDDDLVSIKWPVVGFSFFMVSPFDSALIRPRG
jgi:hypothetical protein